MARVVLENVSKIYRGPRGEPIHAVKDINLAIEDKEFLVLVGPSGCGKSTTLRMIAGLEEISEGKIWMDDKIINDVQPKDRDVAMVFQNYALYPHMTVKENLAFGLKLRKFPKSFIEQRIGEVSRMLGLEPYLHRLPKALSGGERQRVALGRAIARQPKAFLFDEPLSNLDARMRSEMRMELSRLHQRLATTMIYVTHDQVEAMTMGDRIAVLKGGTLQQIADPLTLYNQPSNAFVAGFIGSPSINLFHGLLSSTHAGLFFQVMDPARSGTEVDFEIGPLGALHPRLADKANARLILGVRSEDLAASTEPSAPGAGTLVRAKVEWVEPLGPETYLHLSSKFYRYIVRVPPTTLAAPGQEIFTGFNLAKLHFFDGATEQAIR